MWAAPSISIFEDLRAALTQFAEIAKAMAVVTAHIIAPAEACDQRGLIFCLRSALTLHHKRLTIGIGSVYRSQTHKGITKAVPVDVGCLYADIKPRKQISGVLPDQPGRRANFDRPGRVRVVNRTRI